MTNTRIGVRETFGLSPLPLRAREAWLALRGGGGVPPSRFGVSSLGMLMPWLSVKTWLGWKRPDRRIPIYNLVNRTPTPIEAGWSVEKMHVRDFRGGELTYDSHNGTDFAVPVGTTVVAAAPAKVLRISSEFNRGGLKLFLDHGRGLVTTSNHLARALVRVGDVVARGQPVALSGYSGIDGFLAFPWSVPHVHYNVWLDGETADPFAAEGEAPLWRDGNEPRPSTKNEADPPFEPTRWDTAAVEATIESCRDAELQRTLAAEREPDRRAMNALFHRNYFPSVFGPRLRLHAETHARAPWLTLPFRAEDFDGIAL
jgi:murein DD-endopeptidase MepM/ murein hydrolase activator NlpD